MIEHRLQIAVIPRLGFERRYPMNPVKVFRYGAAVAIENREWGGGKDRNPHLTQGAKVLLYDGPEFVGRNQAIQTVKDHHNIERVCLNHAHKEFKREANLFDLPLQRQERRL